MAAEQGVVSHGEELWLPAGGRRTFARVWGSVADPPVVLVPGLGQSGDYLVPAGARLGARLRVYAPDPPGSGRSNRPPRVLGIGELAEALRAWIEAAGVARPVLLANSVGCQVAVDLAARHPQTVAALVLTSPTTDPAMRSFARQVLGWVREMRTQSPRLRRIVWRNILWTGPIRFARASAYARADHIEDKLPHVACPALVVRGTGDPIVSHDWAREVTRLLPRGQFVEVTGAPHAMVHDATDEVAAAALPFLHQLAATGTGR